MNSKKVTEFERFIDNPEIIKFLESQSLTKPTKVQKDAISPILKGGNFTIQAKTGSGKTFAYLLPIFQRLKEMEAAQEFEPGLKAFPKSVVIAPTRELALQIFSVAKDISHFAKLRVRKLVGGDKGKSLGSLYASEIDLLIATPDRFLRALEKNELKKKEIRYLVLDEADQLLEKSFEKTMSALVLNVRQDLMQVVLVSASRPSNFDQIVKDFFPKREFALIGKGEENVLNHQVEIYNSFLEEDDKFLYIDEFISKQKKRNGLVFTGNKSRAKKVFDLLKSKGKEKLFLLHKDLLRDERVEIVEKFRKSGGVLVATDIFARGIDIPHLHWVLNFDLPSEPDYYLHRSGRVGRAGRMGDVFNFITKKDGERQDKINQVLLNQGREDLAIKSKKFGGSRKGPKGGSNKFDKNNRNRNRKRSRK